MSAFLLVKGLNGCTVYFTGETTEYGMPRISVRPSEAFHFSTPRAAYEAAETHEHLRGSMEWRVVERAR